MYLPQMAIHQCFSVVALPLNCSSKLGFQVQKSQLSRSSSIDYAFGEFPNMSSTGFVDVKSEDKSEEACTKFGERELDSVVGIPKLESKIKTKTEKLRHKSGNDSPREGLKDAEGSNAIDGLGGDCPPVDHSIPYSVSSHRAAPICRQFWKAGNYDLQQDVKAPRKDGRSHLRVHPLFLHSNATSHKWAFGAIAELLDNAIDEIQNGATFVLIDKIFNPRDGSPSLLIKDDGSGMDPEAIRRCMSFGFSDKSLKAGVGQYGNGFKTSSMRLGADVIVFTSHSNTRTRTQSVGLLSYTFLRQTSHDRIVVPLIDYEFDASSGGFKPMLTHGSAQFSSNMSVLLQWSPYSTEELLLNQFDDIGDQGTKIIVYNLWLNGDGNMELDFTSDDEDIRINVDAELIQTCAHPNPVSDQHIANLHRYSLRVYASILYLRLPDSFRIILRGRDVEYHNIANDLQHPEFILYKPHVAGNKAVVTTIGFLKDAPFVNIHGFNVYHRNRLILPFWRVVKDTTNSHARGVVGILEANFIEPTHNKQDFERTSLFQKLEARLKEMTLEYWHCYSGLIGYLPTTTRKHPSLYSTTQSVLLNRNKGGGRTSAHFRTPGLKRKGKKRGPSGSGSHETDARCNPVEQASNETDHHVDDEEMTNLKQENQKLRSQLSELEAMEKGLNQKVQQLRTELVEVQDQYRSLLSEVELANKIKEEYYCF